MGTFAPFREGSVPNIDVSSVANGWQNIPIYEEKRCDSHSTYTFATVEEEGWNPFTSTWWRLPDPQVPQGHSHRLSVRSHKVVASGRPSAMAAPVRSDESIKVLNVVAGGRTNLDDGQLAPGHKTFNRRPRHAEVVGSGTDWQQALASPLWLEYFLERPRCLPLFACR
jgi:hypothetical protein